MNKQQGAYQKYKQVQVETANSGKLLLMLYQGCIKFIRLAEKSIEEGNIEAANNYIIRSQDIINELVVTLDMEQGGQIAKNLYNLYDFMNRQLIEANIHKDVEPLATVEGLMLELLSSWQQIINGRNKRKEDEKVSVNV